MQQPSQNDSYSKELLQRFGAVDDQIKLLGREIADLAAQGFISSDLALQRANKIIDHAEQIKVLVAERDRIVEERTARRRIEEEIFEEAEEAVGSYDMPLDQQSITTINKLLTVVLQQQQTIDRLVRKEEAL